MNLTKIICCMLAFALVIGIFTSIGPEGDKKAANNSQPAASNSESENSSGVGAPEGVKGNEIKNSSDTPKHSKSLVPEPPASSLLKNGSGEIAIQKRFLELRLQTAADLIEREGEAAFYEFREEGSSWYYGDFYIFVGSLAGTLEVYPPESGREGEALEELTDSEGNALGAQFLKIAREGNGEGWLEYTYPKAGNSGPSKKYTFIKRVSGKEQTYFVGSGFYPEEWIFSKNLKECKILKSKAEVQVFELFNPKAFDQKPELDCSLTHSTLEVGACLAPKLLETPKALYVLEGEGVLYVDDVPMPLQPEQFFYLPAGSFQTIYNTGNKSLVFLSVNKAGMNEAEEAEEEKAEENNEET